MIGLLATAHLTGLVAAAIVGRRGMRPALLVAGLAPAATAVWAAIAMIEPAAPVTAELVWVEALDLGFRFRVDDLALVMTLLVSGIGALVFVYAAGYFSADAVGGTRFPPTLLAFSAAMLGLVWADSIWTFFIFWELTSVTSFLLVGHANADPSVTTAARRALLITGGGGLVLLAGLVVMGQALGSTSLTDLQPMTGSGATTAAVLVLVGAATKSAQVPFHVWLPGAMAAPTPVSAYLHSATMVKAGVVLVAVLTPALGGVAAWKVGGLAFGAVSVVWGAVGALRHTDAKLILAWGTVSQLGLLVTLLALGSPKGVFAAVSLLVAHALFKAALFLVVGEIDVRTGTRDVEQLGGLWRSMPVAFGVALAAGLSMAGVPPLLGFMAKEAAIESVLDLSGAELVIGLLAVVGGSVLTVAYTVRFLVGAFGAGPVTSVSPRRLAMTVPAVALAVAGALGYLAAGDVTSRVRPAAAEIVPDAAVYSLLRWPGLNLALGISIAVVVGGAVLGWLLARRVGGSVPAPKGAITTDALIDGVLAFAARSIGWIQHGSLPCTWRR